MRVRDLIRQIAGEHELVIISGKVAKDHIHVFVSYRPNQDEHDRTVVEGDQLAGAVAGVPASAEEVLG